MEVMGQVAVLRHLHHGHQTLEAQLQLGLHLHRLPSHSHHKSKSD